MRPMALKPGLRKMQLQENYSTVPVVIGFTQLQADAPVVPSDVQVGSGRRDASPAHHDCRCGAHHPQS